MHVYVCVWDYNSVYMRVGALSMCVYTVCVCMFQPCWAHLEGVRYSVNHASPEFCNILLL